MLDEREPVMLTPRRTIEVGVNATFVVLFVTAVSLPVVLKLLGWHAGPGLQEKRQLAPWPEIRLSRHALEAFPRQFDAYVGDHFGLREELIHWDKVVRFQLLRTSPSPLVMVGRQGWLYFNGENTIEDYRGLCPLTPEELQHWSRALEERQDWLAARGIRYVFFLAPNKQTIYPEYLPARLKRVRADCRGDQLIDYLRRHSRVNVVDLREPLRTAKEGERLYHRTDTHWNDCGAFVAYQQVVTALSHWFPAVRPLPRRDFIATEAVGDGDLAVLADLADRLQEEQLLLSPLARRRATLVDAGIPPYPGRPQFTQPFATACDDDKLPRAVMFRDSFGINLQPFLSEHFRRILYHWNYVFEPGIVEREKPDVVIEEWVERSLVDPAHAVNAPEMAPAPDG
jgi:hypothetical protein